MVVAAMTLQATLEVCGSVFLAGNQRQVVWDKASFSGQSRRAPFKQLVVGSSRNPGHPRAPIWRGRLLSNEALRAVQELKRAKTRGDEGRLSSVLKSKVARLLQFDMLAVLTELRRQSECDLALMMFDVVRKEFWYKPDEELFSHMVLTMAQNNRIADVDKLYALANAEGIKPSMGFYTEVLSAQVGAGNLQKALEIYDELRKAGYAACNPALSILRKALEKNGELELVATLEKEYRDAGSDAVEEDEADEALEKNGDVELVATFEKEYMDARAIETSKEDEADVRHMVFS